MLKELKLSFGLCEREADFTFTPFSQMWPHADGKAWVVFPRGSLLCRVLNFKCPLPSGVKLGACAEPFVPKPLLWEQPCLPWEKLMKHKSLLLLWFPSKLWSWTSPLFSELCTPSNRCFHLLYSFPTCSQRNARNLVFIFSFAYNPSVECGNASGLVEGLAIVFPFLCLSPKWSVLAHNPSSVLLFHLLFCFSRFIRW